MNTIANNIAAWWRRFTCRLQESHRQRLALRELARMSAYELRDLGLSHAAPAAAGSGPSRCL